MKHLSRSGMAAFSALALLFAASSARGQSTSGTQGGYSLFEVSPFAGYQFGKESGHVSSVGNPFASTTSPSSGREFGNGFTAGIRFGQELSSHFGLEEGFSWARLPNTLTPYPPGSAVELKTNSYKISLNPLVYFTPRESRIRPFVTAGFTGDWFNPGSDHLTSSTDGSGGYPLKTKLLPAFLYGVGLKVNASRRFGIRFDLRDNLSGTPHFNLPDVPSAPGTYYSPRGGKLHQVEATVGLMFRFGYKEPPAPPAPPPPPPPPPAPAKPEFSVDGVTATPNSVCPGEQVELRATTTGAPADASYQWSVGGRALSATGATATVDTKGLTGSQEATVTVSSGGVTKTGSGTFTVKDAGAPTISISINPTTIEYGSKATITPNANASPCGGSPRVAYTATEGTIEGNTFDSSTVSFDPNVTKEQSKTVTITGTVTDSLGATARATADLTVTTHPKARRLDDLVFGKGSGRVNNCAKRILLEELTPLLRDNPDAKVALVGHRDEEEKGKALANIDRVRVLNAAAVLSAGKGICPQLELGRVKMDTAGTDQSSPVRPGFCGTSTNVKERRGQAVDEKDSRAQYRRVEVWFIPAGAEIPAALSNAKAVPEAAVKKLGCPK